MKSIIFCLILIPFLTIPAISFALNVGDKAPLFEAPSTYGNVILSEFHGKKNVVLAFYYADFTPV